MSKALAAASRTFSTPAELPFSSDAATDATFLDGRQRLRGAFSIDIHLIEADPDQPRKHFDTAAQRDLNASVAHVGILQPITVRHIEARGKYRIITGERRFQAAMVAKLKDVPCWVQTPQDSDVLLHQIVENWQRADMHPYDLADALARLRDENGYSQKRIAEHTGKSQGEISKLLTLLMLAPDVQKLAREDTKGRISKRHLYAVARLKPNDQRELIEKVHRRGLDVSDVERLAKNREEGHEEARANRVPAKSFRFKTNTATVTITFREKNVAREDVLRALQEARDEADNFDL